MMFLSGIQIVVSPHHPVVHDGWGEQRYRAHPLVAWLYRAINRLAGTRLDSDIIRSVQRFKDADPLFDRARGIVYCSPRQEQGLRRALREQDGAR